MQKHFVEFFSPGTFVAETSQVEIDSWSVEQAVKMSKRIKERYCSRPYGFQFITRERTDTDLDSREVKRSGTYYLGGKVLTVKDIERRHDPKDSILLSNMLCNKWKRVIQNDNSWRWTQPFEDGDVLLEVGK